MPYFTSKITKKYSIVLSYKPACFMLQQWSLKTLQRLKKKENIIFLTRNELSVLKFETTSRNFLIGGKSYAQIQLARF